VSTETNFWRTQTRISQMKFISFLFIFICFVGFFTNLASAQTYEVGDTTIVEIEHILQPLDVTATRYSSSLLDIPVAVDILERSDIQKANLGLSLEESIRNLPGINVHNRNNLSMGDRISIRGLGSRASFGVRGIKIILDGIPLTMADGQSQLNNLDLTSVGRIEVLRGPSSALYGNSAGGVIQIKTEENTKNSFGINPGLIFGSDGFTRLQNKVTAQKGAYAFFLNFNTLWLNGFREHSFSRSTAVNSIIKRQLGDNWKVSTVLNYYNAPYHFNPSTLDKPTSLEEPRSARFFVQKQGASKRISQFQGGISVKYQGINTKGEISLYGIKRSLFNPIPGGIIDLKRRAGGLRSLFTRELLWNKQKLILTSGLDIEYQRDIREEYGNNGIPSGLVGKLHDSEIFQVVSLGEIKLSQEEKVIGLAPFINLSWIIDPKLRITFGSRYDHFLFEVNDNFIGDNSEDSGSRSMREFSPHWGATYRPTKSIAIYGNISSSFQTPTTSELSNQSQKVGGFNFDLQPERLKGFEIGIKGVLESPNFQYNLGLFGYKIYNMLQPFQVDDANTDEIFFRNAGETNNLGVEAKLAWLPKPDIKIEITYTGMKFRFLDYKIRHIENGIEKSFQMEGNTVPGVPPQHLYAGISFNHPGTKTFFELNGQWVASYFANDFNGPPPGTSKPNYYFVNDSYTLFDLRTGFSYKQNRIGTEFFIGVNNFFNKRFNGSIVPNGYGDRFFEPGSGRTWYCGLTVPLNKN